MFNSIMIISMSDGKLKDNSFCGMSSLIYIRNPPPCLFLSFLKGLENLLIKNWDSGKDWSSLLSVITNISTKSAIVILISSNLFGIELALRVEKINILWLLFFCLYKSNKLFSGPWLELGSEFSELGHWQHWCLDEPQYYHYQFHLSKVNLQH